MLEENTRGRNNFFWIESRKLIQEASSLENFLVMLMIELF